MWEIGSGWDEEGETESALEAYRDLRGAIQGIRGVYKPYGEWLPKVNDRIARLEANLELRATDKKGDSPDPGTTVSPGSSVEKESRAHFETLRRESLERLDKDLAPSTGWSLMVEIGFFGWILCAVLLIVSMNVGSKERRVRMAFIWGVLLCVLFALWLLGMVNA